MNLIREGRANALSDKNWCEEHQIPVSSFYYQVRRLRKMACEIPPKKNSVAEKQSEIVEWSFNDFKVYPMRVKPETKITSSEPAIKLIALA